MDFRRQRASWLLTALAVAICSLPQMAEAQLDDKLEALDAALGLLYDGSAVSVEECVRVAELGSMALGRFEEDLATAKSDRRAALAQWLPNLTSNASWSRQERTDKDQAITESGLFEVGFLDANGNPLPLVVGGEQAYTRAQVPTGAFEDSKITQTFESQSIRSSWTVFNGFDRFAERNQAEASLKASVSTLGYQRTVLREQVIGAYYDLIRAKQRVVVAMDAEELARQELERSQTYFDLGISTKSDMLQAKVRHQQTRLDVVRERNGQRNAFASLAHAMSIPASRTFEVRDDLLDVSALELPEPYDLVELAKSARQDLAATRFRLDATQSGVTRARSSYYPAVEVFGSWSRSVSETPFRFGAQENSTLSWGIQGQWSIFDRFRSQQQVRQAVASRRRGEYDLRQAELDMELEIVQLYNNLTEAVESYEVSEVSVEQSQEDLRLAEERFRVGAGTALDVITAQVNLAQARRDLVDAQVNYAKFLNQLERAVGGSLN